MPTPEEKEYYQNLLEMAVAGDRQAMDDLASARKKGMGPQDESLHFIEWMEQAAKTGSIQAMLILAKLYYTVEDVKDDQKLYYWTKRAADAGNAGAMYSLCLLYNEGIGVEKNPYKSFEWLEKAADAGDEDARNVFDMD